MEKTLEAGDWRTTACILCECNCGIEVRSAVRTGGASSGSGATRPTRPRKGYTCEKALRLDHYQNGRHRLTSPAAPPARRHASRRSTGTPPSPRWPPASPAVRDAHGGESIFYYGGGGQGNHLGGAYGGALLAGPRRRGSARTPWPRRRPASSGSTREIFGAVRSGGDFEHAEVARASSARTRGSPTASRAPARSLKEIAKDPERALIVIDPRRTETAELADFHLQVRPGTDAWCLAALLGVLVQEDLARPWLPGRARRRRGGGRWPSWGTSPSPTTAPARGVARGAGAHRRPAHRRRAGSVSTFEDLGIQQEPPLDAQLLPGEAALAADRQLRQAGRDGRALQPAGPGAASSPGGRRAPRPPRSPAPGSSPGWCPAT